MTVSNAVPFTVTARPPAFTRTAAGLLARYDATDVAAPFATGDWTTPGDGSVAFSIVANKLRLSCADLADNSIRFVTLAAVAARQTALVQMISQALDLGAAWGPILRATAGTSYADAMGAKMKLAFALQAQDSYTLFDANGGALLQTVSAPGNQTNQSQDERLTIFAGTTSLRSYNGAVGAYDKTFVPTGTPNTPSGRAGIGHRSDFFSRIDVARYVVCTHKDVVVTGALTNGQIVKVRTVGGATVASAVVAGGVATIDLLAVNLDATAYDLALYQGDGVTLVDSYAPAGGVWPGDTYLR